MNTCLNRTISNEGFRYELAKLKNTLITKVFKETAKNGGKVSWYNDEVVFDQATPYKLLSHAAAPSTSTASTSTASLPLVRESIRVPSTVAQTQRLITLYGESSGANTIKTSKETAASFAAKVAAVEGFPSVGHEVEVMCSACGE